MQQREIRDALIDKRRRRADAGVGHAWQRQDPEGEVGFAQKHDWPRDRHERRPGDERRPPGTWQRPIEGGTLGHDQTEQRQDPDRIKPVIDGIECQVQDGWRQVQRSHQHRHRDRAQPPPEDQHQHESGNADPEHLRGVHRRQERLDDGGHGRRHNDENAGGANHPRVNDITVSMWSVWGNMSTGCTRLTR